MSTCLDCWPINKRNHSKVLPWWVPMSSCTEPALAFVDAFESKPGEETNERSHSLVDQNQKPVKTHQLFNRHEIRIDHFGDSHVDLLLLPVGDEEGLLLRVDDEAEELDGPRREIVTFFGSDHQKIVNHQRMPNAVVRKKLPVRF